MTHENLKATLSRLAAVAKRLHRGLALSPTEREALNSELRVLTALLSPAGHVSGSDSLKNAPHQGQEGTTRRMTSEPLAPVSPPDPMETAAVLEDPFAPGAEAGDADPTTQPTLVMAPLPSGAAEAAWSEGAVSEAQTLQADTYKLSEGSSLMAALLAAAPPPGEAPAPGSDLQAPERYIPLRLLGQGGMGQVWLVQDQRLGRPVALKTLPRERRHDRVATWRLRDEAAATAQLQHPSIIPVYDRGTLPDGRPYFTMKVVQGQTLEALVKEVHAASTSRAWGESPEGWSLRRLLQALQQACAAVAYAHHHGVIHRDLKPANIMIGHFNEVLVLDWGLARLPSEPMPMGEDAAQGPVSSGSMETQIGHLAGTPAYMSPEQVRDGIDQLGPPSDVYGLGATLYTVLTGRSPYHGKSASEILLLIEAGPPSELLSGVPPGGREDEGHRNPPIDPALWEVCRRAMAPSIEDRFPNGEALIKALTEWLEGSRRREQATALVHKADGLREVLTRTRREAEGHRRKGEEALGSIPSWAPSAQKHGAWKLEDRAERMERRAGVDEIRYLEFLRGALVHDADLALAHRRLADYFRERHERAERALQLDSAAQMEVLLKSHDIEGLHAPYLKRQGWLTLHTDPPGVRVIAHRYVERERYLQTVEVADLGPTPIDTFPLGAGSFQLRFQLPWGGELRYPVFIERAAHLIIQRPGSPTPTPIPLGPARRLGRDDLYVGPGPFLSGGDPKAHNGMPRAWAWADGFIIGRHPITNAEYLEFLNALVALGRREEALQAVPREKAARLEQMGARIYHDAPGGRFALGPDGEGHERHPDHPVVDIPWRGAAAYCAWRAARDGLPWRLPHPMEWEKAARGADGRVLPWGRYPEPSWCCGVESRRAEIGPCSVQAFPRDVSPFGMRGAGGNVMDWCQGLIDATDVLLDSQGLIQPLEQPDPGQDFGIARGGMWYGGVESPRVASLWGQMAHRQSPYLGFRIARSV